MIDPSASDDAALLPHLRIISWEFPQFFQPIVSAPHFPYRQVRIGSKIWKPPGTIGKNGPCDGCSGGRCPSAGKAAHVCMEQWGSTTTTWGNNVR